MKRKNFPLVAVFLIILFIGIASLIKTESQKIDYKSCSNASSKPQCWEGLVDSALRNGGIRKAFEIVETLYASEPEFASDCHAYVHEIGSAAYNLFSKDKDFELSSKTSYCGYGFFHAFMESLVTKGDDLTRARKFCDYVDKQLGSQSAYAKGACYHGIGHGVADNHDVEYWNSEEELAAKPLQLCNQIALDETLLHRCGSGVFNVMAINYNSGRLAINKQDPFQFCRKQSLNYYKRACYEEMNTALFALTQSSFLDASRFVEGISEDEYANASIRSLAGLWGVSNAQNPNFGPIVDNCRKLQQRLRLGCFGGFAAGLIEGGQPHQEYVRALSFCSDARLSSDEKTSCYKETLWMTSHYYPKEKHQQICQSINNEFRVYCDDS